ncbi:MAG: biotin--[acetyl-CoA-carboxylase] ligase [Candidatus Thioglobus sp.]|uniref:biotin--[acetyl-CoA-carboxylase] ligase n=1 Tax=Candidatus Thioglobus sp. TaxID=2026721 RepID=UPI002614483D|nr:biotin--[acetyl-CoA-carboxylase] ligase [Candidatus Thioglobus sp.]MDC9726615.1 biotin--[acetyl-CoA-carboxylase] ligase [Candidatus Thioglobus sp.]
MADYPNLESQINTPVTCVVFDSIASTNDYLSTLAFSKTPQVCIAREQTQGRGQYDRAWLSCKDASILLSVRFVFDANVALNGLSLVMGLAVIEALENLGISGAKLKWPNDVYVDDKKLAGILIENSAQGQYQSVVIGLGLNYCLDQDFKCDSPWIDLARILKDLPAIEDLSAKLINHLIAYCQLFAEQGWSYFLATWNSSDYLLGRAVELELSNQKIIGKACGVNAQGALLIEANNQLVEAYSSKQIRLI